MDHYILNFSKFNLEKLVSTGIEVWNSDFNSKVLANVPYKGWPFGTT